MNKYPFLALATLFLITSACSSGRSLFRQGSVDQSSFVEEIPFTLENDLIFVNLEMAGKTFRFILDTGAPNVVTEEAAEALNLEREVYGNVSDSQGQSSQLESVVLPPVKLGNLTFSNTAALVADMRAIPIFDCMQVDGLLGSNLMAKTVVQIDFKEQVVRMASNRSAYNVTHPIRLPFSLKTTYTPVIKSLQVGDLAVENITLDYGSGNGLTLPQDLFSEATLDAAPVVSRGASGTGLYGTGRGEIFYTPAHVPAFGADSILLRIRPQSNRLLGVDILKQFKATIDWQRKELLLERQVSGWPEWKAFGMGIELVDDHLEIGTITTPSPAAEMGLQVGQRVLRINGRPMTANDYCWFTEEARTMESLAIAVETEDGEREVKLIRSVIR
jgi:hypothetical protein